MKLDLWICGINFGSAPNHVLVLCPTCCVCSLDGLRLDSGCCSLLLVMCDFGFSCFPFFVLRRYFKIPLLNFFTEKSETDQDQRTRVMVSSIKNWGMTYTPV